MGDGLDYVIYFVGSGLAFFVGVTCILVGVAISPWTNARAISFARNMAVLLGGLLVAISAAPLDGWLYGVVAACTCVWLPIEWCNKWLPRTPVLALRVGVSSAWMIAVCMEAPYHLMPTLPALNRPTLFLIGDSVSAGMSDADKTTWPRLFAQQHPVDIRDFSRMGATVKSARRQAEKLGNESGLVLLEIGGNDLLGSTTADQFEEQLDLLLADVCRAERTVVMLGLPLPPMGNRFGLIQRRLARKYDVILVPQRVFAGLVTAPGATIDGIHLTPKGHQMMADTMWGMFGVAYK